MTNRLLFVFSFIALLKKIRSSNSNTTQALWVGLGSFTMFSFGIISSMILSRYLDKIEYGTYRQVLYVYNTLLVVFAAGLPRVFGYFLPRYNLAQGATIVKKISLLLFFLGALFSLCLFLGAGTIAKVLNNEDLSIGLKAFSPIPMFLLPTLGIEGVFSSYKQSHYIAYYQFFSRLLLLLGVLLPVFFIKSSYLYVIYGWSVSSFFTLILAIFFKIIPFKKVVKEKVSLSFRDILSYSIPLVFASIAGMVIKAADQFYISRYFGAEVFAEFSNGFVQLPFVEIVTGSTSVVLIPVFSKYFSTYSKGQDLSYLIDLWKGALSKSAILLYPLVVFFIAFSQDVIIILFSEEYLDSSYYFAINMTLNFVNILVFAPIFFAMKRTRVYSIVHILIAIFVWITHYLVIVLVNSPLGIAVNSTIFGITKTLILGVIVTKLLDIPFISFFPIRLMFRVFIHSVLIAFPVKILSTYCSFSSYTLVNLLMYFLIFILSLLMTSKLFNIKYHELFFSLLRKSN